MKTTEELIKEFLENGGEIEKLPTIEPDNKKVIGSTSKKVPELMTLGDAELMFGEKVKRKRKEKEPDYSDIDISLIPEHLRQFIKKPADDKQDDNHKGEIGEADQNS